MIIDFFINIISGILNVLLFPIQVINVGVNFLYGLPVVSSFLECVAYVLPWSNLLPLITLTIGIFVFRAVVALVKTIWDLLPIV